MYYQLFQLEAEYVSFDELLSRSDVVVAACSVGESNREMFNMDAFRKMKNSAVLINIARGALVNHDHLLQVNKNIFNIHV